MNNISRRIKTEHIGTTAHSPVSDLKKVGEMHSSPLLSEKKAPREHPLRKIQRKQTINELMV